MTHLVYDSSRVFSTATVCLSTQNMTDTLWYRVSGWQQQRVHSSLIWVFASLSSDVTHHQYWLLGWPPESHECKKNLLVRQDIDILKKPRIFFLWIKFTCDNSQPQHWLNHKCWDHLLTGPNRLGWHWNIIGPNYSWASGLQACHLLDKLGLTTFSVGLTLSSLWEEGWGIISEKWRKEPIYKLDCGNNIYGANGVNILHDEVLLLMPASPTTVGLSTGQRTPLAVWGS